MAFASWDAMVSFEVRPRKGVASCFGHHKFILSKEHIVRTMQNIILIF